MRISGKKGSHLFYVLVNIMSPFLKKGAIIRFVVDTGAAITSIGMKDAIRNGINILEFEKTDNQVTGVGGAIDAYILPKCKVLFLTDDGNINVEHMENLDFIHMFHEPKINEIGYSQLPSLLGIDILQRFKISFVNNRIFLEK